MASTGRRVKHVVADSAAFIRNAPLREIGNEIYSLPEVVAEIKDKQTKQRLQFLPYQLEYRVPSPESVKIVTEFSKKTGDYLSLSGTDIKVLALTYQLEKEYVGTQHIKTTPDTKVEINLSTPAAKDQAQIAGFYLGKRGKGQKGKGERSSKCAKREVKDGIDKVTSAFQRQTLEDEKLQASDDFNDNADNYPSLSRDPDMREDIATPVSIYSENRDDSGGCVNLLDDEDEFPSLSNAAADTEDMQSESSEIDPDKRVDIATPVSIYSENRDDSGGGVNLLDDEDEFPSLSIAAAEPEAMQSESSDPDKRIDIATPVNIYSENRDDSSKGGHVNHLGDEEEFPSLCRVPDSEFPSEFSSLVGNAIDNLSSQVAQVFIEVKDESGIEDSQDNDDPVLSSEEYPSLIHSGPTKMGKLSTNTFSYARITKEGEAKVQPAPATKRVFHEGQVLPSNLIGDDDESEEEDDEEDEGIEEEDDGQGWITPSNIKNVKKQMGNADKEKAEVVVGCLTTDFAMQNVLIQMGLNVISVDGMLIKRAKSYVLRCFACFKVTSQMDKLFCPHCGNHTLKRIAMAVKDDGTVKYFFSRRKQLTTRGLRQSLPAPKGGKHAINPLLVADQPMPHQRPTKKSLQGMDVFDPDFVASESPFSKRDVTSRAAQLGIMRRGQAGGKRHQTGKKSGGRRK